MGNSVSFESSDLAGAMQLASNGDPAVFLTSYGFSSTSTLSFGVIAAIAFFSSNTFFGGTDTDNIGVQPVLTFPVIDAAGAASTSVVTCAPFNDGVLPTQDLNAETLSFTTATNQLTCAIPNTAIAPGIVTIAFEKSDGSFFTDASYGFLVADSTILTDTVTATNTVFVPGSTVGSTTVTSTRYIFTDEATSTSTTTLLGASSTTYISCSTSTSATTTGTATADPNSTSATDASRITSATDSSSTRSSTDSSSTSSSAIDDSSSTTISDAPTAPTYPTDSNPASSSSTSCTTNQAAPPHPQKTLYARQTTATDTLASGFGAPDFTFSNGDNTATITVTSTAIDTQSTVVTSGTDTSIVTESDTTTTITVTSTVDERTVETVVGCEPTETASGEKKKKEKKKKKKKKTPHRAAAVQHLALHF
ncbi:hypothetical protein TI39_contig615g00015 [Zymoseptoria brevis]|uniref:Uncharacterized protein n=1 Tax=Zymoseptoria brevis TaxID=1047168 RepID=A0A0F4GGN2_9PEZI|nr:hypothetical protein TI39_contig615g00015 [Zymoseptoria brevis]